MTIKFWSRLAAGPLLVTAALLFASPAQAHTVLVGSSPAVNSTVTTLPSQLTLTFADNLLQVSSKVLNSVSVTDSMNMEIASNTVVKGNTLTADLRETMAMSGTFTVNYRVVALDGHVVTGKYKFIVGAKASSSPTVAIPTSGTQNLMANLTGSLAGVKNSSASGVAHLAFNFTTQQVCYTVSESGLTGITAMHLHPMMQGSSMNMTVSDEVFILLNNNAVNASTPICTPVKPLMMAEIVANPSHYAVMIHTMAHPDGAIAGWLKKSN